MKKAFIIAIMTAISSLTYADVSSETDRIILDNLDNKSAWEETANDSNSSLSENIIIDSLNNSNDQNESKQNESEQNESEQSESETGK